MFLQALAWAPLVALTLRRAATRGGRAIVLASAVLALALSTLALEFVAQAVLLGLGLGLAARPGAVTARRLARAIVLGAGLAGVPLAVTAGLLSETVRGAGFSQDVALANAVPLVGLLQVLVPNLFGPLTAPEAWWGGAFFSKGLPYFLSIYLGPLALALAWAGLPAAEPRTRMALLGLSGLALWYSLGQAGGLAPLLLRLPLFSSLRFPSKALLLPHLAVALLAGLGAERLRQGLGWTRVAAASAIAASITLGVAAGVTAGGPRLAAWAGIEMPRFPAVVDWVVQDALPVAAVALVTLVLAVIVACGRVPAEKALALLLALLVFDLARAGVGVNPQTAPSFFAPLPEVKALWPGEETGGRVFSYGLDHSPAVRAFLARGGPNLGLATFFVNRQILAPYSNLLDRVEAAEATDLTSFVPRPRELGPADYDPRAAGALVPWLRNAAVSHVLSLDPLEHPDLAPLAAVEVLPGATVHGYRVREPWPHAQLACRVALASGAEDALRRPYEVGFDPTQEVALEEPAAASCHEGTARLESFLPGDERYEVTSDGTGLLLTRYSFARGWRASVGGVSAPVLRANGKHRAVPVPAGTHKVRLQYRPPGLFAGMTVTALALAGAALTWLGGRREGARA